MPACLNTHLCVLFACARMLITFTPIWMFAALCVHCIFCVYNGLCEWACVCVATPGSHLREWSAAACLSLAEAPKGRRIRERENERVQHRREQGHAARPPGYLLQPIKG